MSYYDDGTAEFYWNVTGDGWVVPIEMVRAAVLGEESVRILEDERDCYVGRSGDTDRCESALVEGLGLGFGAGSLRPRQQLTIAVAVDAETVEKNIVEHFIFHPIALLYVIFVIGFIVYIAVRIRRWRNQGKGNQPVIVQYGSYPDFDPLYTQAFYFGYLQHPGLIAGLITLAQQGVIHLQRIETQQSKTILGRTASRPQVDYEITLKTNTDSVQDPYLKRVIRVFFADTINAPHKVRMSEVVKDRSRTLREFNQLKTAISNSIFNQDNGYYVQDFPKKEYKFYVISLVILGILSIVGIYWLMFFSMILLFMIFALGMYLGLSVKNGHRMTAQGHEIYRHIEGFKKFLCLTERDRLQFHNAPTRSPETYMQYLPYAIALGVEKEWAAAFADVTIPEQDWYSDTSANATFSGLLLSRELGSFTRTAATSPQSSSSSSGSSGRGSAGGGSGGGGGGSW